MRSSSLRWCILISLAGMAAPAWAQAQRLPTVEPGAGAARPDQAVMQQLPRLEQRAPQPAAPEPQPQKPPPPPFTLSPQEEAEVDRVLNLWEEHNRNIKTFDCRFKRWIYDVVFGSPTEPKFVDLGVVKYAKPDRGLFRIDATEKEGKEVNIDNARAEHWLSDGRSIFVYSPGKKQLIEQQLPPAMQGKAIADGPLPFVFGAEAKKLKERYWIRLLPPNKDEKDQNLPRGFSAASARRRQFPSRPVHHHGREDGAVCPEHRADQRKRPHDVPLLRHRGERSVAAVQGRSVPRLHALGVAEDRSARSQRRAADRPSDPSRQRANAVKRVWRPAARRPSWLNRLPPPPCRRRLNTA